MVTVRQKEDIAAKVRNVETTCKEGTYVEVKTETNHTFATDEPIPAGGQDKAAAPLMYLSGALASCQSVQITKVAEAMRFEHGTINIKCSTTTDFLTSAHEDKPVMRFCAAELIIDLETNESEKKTERLKAVAEDRCPVGRLFADAGYPPVLVWNILPMPS